MRPAFDLLATHSHKSVARFLTRFAAGKNNGMQLLVLIVAVIAAVDVDTVPSASPCEQLIEDVLVSQFCCF